MKRKIKFSVTMIIALFAIVACCPSCDQIPVNKAVSNTGVKSATAKVVTNLDGNTIEQENIKEPTLFCFYAQVGNSLI